MDRETAWQDIDHDGLSPPAYDQRTVEVLLSNGIVVEAIYRHDLRLMDAQTTSGPSTSGWVKTSDLAALPYPPVKWRTLA